MTLKLDIRLIISKQKKNEGGFNRTGDKLLRHPIIPARDTGILTQK